MTPPSASPAPGPPTASAPIASAPTRSVFTLAGPSIVLDPRTNAVRPDLADIRLAGQIFAPHFAAALPCRATRAVPVMAAAQGDAVAARLAAGDAFEVLELSGTLAWGIAVAPGLVGYVDRDALEAVA